MWSLVHSNTSVPLVCQINSIIIRTQKQKPSIEIEMYLDHKIHAYHALYSYRRGSFRQGYVALVFHSPGRLLLIFEQRELPMRNTKLSLSRQKGSPRIRTAEIRIFSRIINGLVFSDANKQWVFPVSVDFPLKSEKPWTWARMRCGTNTQLTSSFIG